MTVKPLVPARTIARVAVAEFSALVPRRLGERRRHAVRTPAAAAYLRGAFLPVRAMDDAIGARAALAVGAAVIARGILREFAAGGRACALERVGVHRREGEVARVRRAAKRQGAGQDRAGQDEESNRVSQGLVPLRVKPPLGGLWHRLSQRERVRMSRKRPEVRPFGFVNI